ncbi:MAG: hypothetical protein Salg2KO_09250 [Salibacteraceae bacterium]
MSVVKAQDIHFSQFFATPLFTNPALTGGFEGTYRMSGVIRRQWASVSAQPFQTFGGGAEFKAPLNIKPIGIGLRLSHDYTGLSSFTQSSIAVPIGVHLELGSAKRIRLSFGGQAEFFQRTIDYSRISFDDQFFGNRYRPEAPSAETVPQASIGSLNASAGVYLERKVNDRQRIGIGFSSFNLNQPNLSVFATSENRLPRRHNLHILTSIPLGVSPVDIMPAAQFQIQGTHDELLIGTAFRYHLASTPLEKRSVQMGIWGRRRDAAYASVGFTQNNLFVGGSYDFNLNRLRVASEYFGGWEVTIIYTIATVREKIKRVRQCPDFL